MREIIEPTMRGMAELGAPFSGVLFAGLMITADGPKLIEYNVRFGDPECQVLMMRLKDDLLVLLNAAADGQLAHMSARWRDEAALTVVMAAKGYPGTPEKGTPIAGIAAAREGGAEVFHAGTALEDGKLVANGGRVLNVTATGKTVAEAQTERLCGGRPDRLAGRLLPPRHRLARGRAGEAWRVGVRHRKNFGAQRALPLERIARRRQRQRAFGLRACDDARASIAASRARRDRSSRPVRFRSARHAARMPARHRRGRIRCTGTFRFLPACRVSKACSDQFISRFARVGETPV